MRTLKDDIGYGAFTLPDTGHPQGPELTMTLINKSSNMRTAHFPDSEGVLPNPPPDANHPQRQTPL